MVISGFLQVFLCASFGGFLAELLRWHQIRESPHFPEYARGARYWVVTTLMIVSGGALAVLYGTDPQSAILVLHIGLSAPLIIKTLAQTRAGVPEPTPVAAPAPAPVPATPPPAPSARRGRSMGRAPRPQQPAPSITDFLAGR